MKIPFYHTTILTLALAFPATAVAQEAHSELATSVPGQPQMAAGNYTLDAAFDPTGQALTQTAGATAVLKLGFAGQITDPRSLEITVPDVDEGGTAEAGATATLDDGTTVDLPPEAVGWEVLDGPVESITVAGVIRSGQVFEDTAASLRGVWLDIDRTAAFTVINTSGDYFGAVAGDGIDDAWQFLYFDRDGDGALDTEEAEAAQPDADPDGDDQDNRFEFLSDHAPDDPDSFLDIRITGVSSGTVTIELSKVVASTRYTLLGSGDLGVTIPWTEVAPAISGVDQSGYQIQHSSAKRYFYQLRLEPAP